MAVKFQIKWAIELCVFIGFIIIILYLEFIYFEIKHQVGHNHNMYYFTFIFKFSKRTNERKFLLYYTTGYIQENF